MSSSQLPTPTTRLETCSEKCVTSKLGRPEASSITIFGPLLLLRHLLGQHLDAGERLELLLVGLQVVGARALGQADDDLLALALLPVEGGLRARPEISAGAARVAAEAVRNVRRPIMVFVSCRFLAAGIPLRNAGALVCWLASSTIRA